MNKYKLLFDLLKPKVGPDPARIIIYDIFCNDTNKPTLWLGEHMRKIYKSSYSGLFTYDLFETKYNNITGKFQLSFGFCCRDIKKIIYFRKLYYDTHYSYGNINYFDLDI